MRYLAILISIVIFSSCSKRLVQLENTMKKVRIDRKMDSTSLVQVKTNLIRYQVSYSDQEHDYYIDIVPGDEPVQYSPATGFQGKAKSIKVYGKKKENHTEQTLESGNKDSLSISKKKLDENIAGIEKSKLKSSDRTGSGFWSLALYLLGVVIIFVLFLLIRHVFFNEDYIRKLF